MSVLEHSTKTCMGTGNEWVECACTKWLNKDCVEEVVVDVSGLERLCPFCVSLKVCLFCLSLTFLCVMLPSVFLLM